MALTPFRWIAGAIIGMLLVSMAVMTDTRRYYYDYRPTTPSEVEGSRLQFAQQASASRASSFARQYRIARVADSLRPLVARAEPRAIRVSYGANVREPYRVAIDTLVLKARERVGPTLKMGVDVVAVRDSMLRGELAYYETYGVVPFYIFPRNTTERCVAVLPIGQYSRTDNNTIQRTLNTEDGQHQVLGPCAYYAAFGMPGSQVREWLGRRGAALSFGGSWTKVAEQPSLRDADMYFKRDPYYGIGHAALEFLSHRGIRCAVGELDACEAGLLESNARGRQLAVGSAISPLRRLGPSGYREGGDFGGRETELLAGMVRSLGRERFAAFWTSNEPLPAAFEKASGGTLGAWVNGWVKERMDPLKRGPKIPGLTLLWAALVVIGCALAGTLAAMRRQYS